MERESTATTIKKRGMKKDTEGEREGGLEISDRRPILIVVAAGGGGGGDLGGKHHCLVVVVCLFKYPPCELRLLGCCISLSLFPFLQLVTVGNGTDRYIPRGMPNSPDCVLTSRHKQIFFPSVFFFGLLTF